MLNPCCCISPRVGTLIFGIIDLVLSASYTANVIRVILNGGGNDFARWIDLALAVLGIFLACLLIFGALRKEQEKIRLWLILMIAFIICLVIFSIFDVYHHSGVAKFRPDDGSRLGGILLFIYQLWVVWAYLHELRYGPAGLTYCPAQIV